MSSELAATEHLSDLRFDRLLARELDGTPEREAALTHMAGCAACADRYGAFERQAAAFADASARRRLAEGVERRTKAAHRRRWAFVGALAMGAASLGVFLLVRPRAAPDGDLHPKGSLAMEVWVARRGGGAPESLLPGAAVSPGDALRFRPSTRTDGHLAVASVDGAGVVNLYVPAASARLPAIRSGTTLLDGAIELDRTLGRERLIVLLCPLPLPSAQVIAALEGALRAAHGDAAALEVDGTGLGCAHTDFWLRKVAAR
jgi:hypothetical protein